MMDQLSLIQALPTVCPYQRPCRYWQGIPIAHTSWFRWLPAVRSIYRFLVQSQPSSVKGQAPRRYDRRESCIRGNDRSDNVRIEGDQV